MKVRLTERDIRMFVKCAVCRWLTTTQIQKLYFPDKTINAVQKRLRKLSDAAYLRSEQEHRTSEAVHAVGPKAKPVVEEKGIEAILGTEVPRQLEHLLGVNEIRIAIEASAVRTVFFFGYFQLADLGWKYRVIPDGVFAVKDPERRTFVLEYDRGTETLDKLLVKLQRYDSGLPEFPFEAVLIITEGSRRLELLSRELRRKNLTVVVLASALEDIKAVGFFQCDFLELHSGRLRKVLAPPAEGGDD